MKNVCSCIIPFYNEELRPIQVIESVVKVKSLSKIIVVDDGSKDEKAYKEIKFRFPRVLAIRLKINSGKAEAIKEGLKYVDSEYVILLDGDLLNIIPSEFENAIKKITENPSIDMLILRRMEDKTVVVSKWIRHDIIFSGQRVLKTMDLQKVFETKIFGYQIEVAINTYMMRNHKTVYWMPSSVHNIHKFKKWPFWEGWKIGLKMSRGFISYAGWKNFIWQTLYFCRQGAP